MSTQELMAFCEKFGVMAGFAFSLLICGMSILWKIMFDVSKRMSLIEQSLIKLSTTISSIERDVEMSGERVRDIDKETRGVRDSIEFLGRDIKDVSNIVAMKRRDLEDKLKGVKKIANLENSFDASKNTEPSDYD